MKTEKEVLSLIAGLNPDEFTPYGWYNSEGDAAEFYWLNEDYSVDYVDEHLSIFRSTSDPGRFVGCAVKHLQRDLLKVSPTRESAMVLVSGQTAKVSVFLMGAWWMESVHVEAGPPGEVKKIYADLWDMYGEVTVPFRGLTPALT
ncbi:MAG: hypothetical protein O7H41_15890 [Planctomycetota bacterium]|nr:hypothetical protein [Planctomycetota bacterium]